MDQARLSVSELVDNKSLISNLLAAMKPTNLATLLDLGAQDTTYCAPRDVARNGQQHTETLAIIFSGSQNNGVSCCDAYHNPFHVTREGGVSSDGKPIPRVSWKENFEDVFPRMAYLESLETSKEIPHYLLPRGFLKKSGRQPTPTSSSTSSSSSSSMLSPKTNSSEVYSVELCDDTSSINSFVQDLSTTSPEQTTTKQLFVNGDVTEHYVLENIKSNNRGYCSLLVAGSTPLTMEFNLDETCSEVIEFDSLPGTHRWMLFKDIALEGTVVIYAGVYMSITKIDSKQKLTCCVEIMGPLDVLRKVSPKFYKLNKDFFRIPELLNSSPVSVEA